LEGRTKERKDLERVQSEVQQKQKAREDKIRANMVNYIGKTKEELKQEVEKERSEIH